MSKNPYRSWTKEEDKLIVSELEKTKGNQTQAARNLINVIEGRSVASIQSRASKIKRGIARRRKGKKKRVLKTIVNQVPKAVKPESKDKIVKIHQKNITKSYLSAEGELILHIKF